MFAEEYFSKLPDDIIESSLRITNAFSQEFAKDNPTAKQGSPQLYKKYSEAFVAAKLYIEKNNININIPDISIGTSDGRFFSDIQGFYTHWRTWAQAQDSRRSRINAIEDAEIKYAKMMGSQYVFYEFQEDEYQFIQNKLNEIRDLITKAECFSNEHRKRLLKRLESLQAEFHKTMSNLDKFFGFFADMGVASGKFGNDIKPITDRYCEVMEATAKVMGRAEGVGKILPAPPITTDDKSKQLNAPKE